MAISTESYRRSFTFRGTWEWNKPPKDLKMVKSDLTFKKVLKNFFQQLYFAEVVAKVPFFFFFFSHFTAILWLVLVFLCVAI